MSRHIYSKSREGFRKNKARKGTPVYSLLIPVGARVQRLIKKSRSFKFSNRSLTLSFLILVFSGWYYQCLPAKIFADPTSTVLLDRDGNLLGACIAADGQWRFKAADPVPEKFEICLLRFEDRGFYRHAGISITAMCRAVLSNISAGHIVSGGSTLSMQLARMMRHNPPRTFFEKVIEMILATRLELRYSKRELLCLYAGHAPFGNNVVGLEAASWRYYGRSAYKLSWAEIATLAVLPNAPGLIYPGKNHERLLRKRNRLLKSLFEAGLISATDAELALTEPLPGKPLPLPLLAPHLLAHAGSTRISGLIVKSTLSSAIQQRACTLLEQHGNNLAQNKVFNGAVLIASVQTGEVLAYVGNTKNNGNEHSNYVDCTRAARSTGSILKPFLYASAMRQGLINPNTLLLDVPVNYGNFRPRNYSGQCDGAVPAGTALARSLNIPFVRLLNAYGPEKFLAALRDNFPAIRKPAAHYGLSLILGGAEATLWDLTNTYLQVAQGLVLNSHYLLHYTGHAIKPVKTNALVSGDACNWYAFEAMAEVNRPDEDGNWRVFAGSRKIAWKTGTSYGSRDAWAIGVTPDYVVSVWLGNAGGEGRPGLTGIKAAAPLLFDLFNMLPQNTGWFKPPLQQMVTVAVCRESGYRANSMCEHPALTNLPLSCLETELCPYHRQVHLNKAGTQLVDSECAKPYEMKHVPWFVLPPVVLRYYKAQHPEYRMLPPYQPGCAGKLNDKPMVLLYPKAGSKIYIPVGLDGSRGKMVSEATHRDQAIHVYWHLDEAYLGETNSIHQLALSPPPGKHTLMLIDENGITQTVDFEITTRKND